MSLPRTWQRNLFPGQQQDLKISDTERGSEILRRVTAGLTIKEAVGGYVHTPTTMANFTAPSMQKHESCRNYVRAFGQEKIWPECFEYLMGYPIGWTDLER